MIAVDIGASIDFIIITISIGTDANIDMIFSSFMSLLLSIKTT